MSFTSENRLRFESSPYLLQHKDNPVHWFAWDDQAFQYAHQENKPILLSIGYAACHWCHIMAHESFENPEVAKIMNDHYINIKVDREERPDIDYIYQNALSLLGEHGGWPLTMFLTPDGHPFWGGTYFPPEAVGNRPGFTKVLREIAEIYQKDPDKIQSNVKSIGQALERLSQNKSGALVSLETIDRIAERITRHIDPFYGGFGGAPKFPQCTNLEVLWRAWLRSRKTPFKNAVVHTLLQICQGGIYDHLRGGFARYSIDEAWLVPHFEKMLSDNALLIDLLTLVWQDTQLPLFEQRVTETIEWVLVEMMTGPKNDEKCAFAASLDADSEGIEGKFYVWSEEEIDQVLGKKAAEFKNAYNVTRQGNWEGKTILSRSHTLLDDQTENLTNSADQKLFSLRKQLLEVRNKRIPPQRDDKIITDWNGLMISALANAGMVFGVQEWLEAAKKAYDFIYINMISQGRLFHCWSNEKARHPAILDDYVNLCKAALTLYEATGSFHYVNHAKEWEKILETHYWDNKKGGYYLTADDAVTLIVRSKHSHDNAVPSGNGTMIGVLARLYLLTHEKHFLQRIEELNKAFSGNLAENFFPFATFLNNIEFWNRALHIVIVGKKDDKETQKLKHVVLQRGLPNKLMSTYSHTDPITDLPQFLQKVITNTPKNVATAYVCTDMTCSVPLTSPEDLNTHLNSVTLP